LAQALTMVALAQPLAVLTQALAVVALALLPWPWHWHSCPGRGTTKRPHHCANAQSPTLSIMHPIALRLTGLHHRSPTLGHGHEHTFSAVATCVHHKLPAVVQRFP
jgi:hypothetical protein